MKLAEKAEMIRLASRVCATPARGLLALRALSTSTSTATTTAAAQSGGETGVFGSRLFRLGLGFGVGLGLAVTAVGLEDGYTYATVSKLSVPLLHLLEPETSHNIVVTLAKFGLVARDYTAYSPSLRTEVWGRSFKNPIGLAAGFDKNAEAMDAMLGIGFGFVEVGSITPEPQDGNARPRVFRIPEESAVINRIGCNSHGSVVVSERIQKFREDSGSGASSLLGINIAKNRTSENAAGDYARACKLLADKADYVVINVSSPNTPGLRSLQAGRELAKIVSRTKQALSEAAPGVPLVVKIAPDLGPADKKQIARVVLRHGVDGMIVSNTTVSRPEPVASHPLGGEKGGLSGKPVREASTALIREMYELTGGRVPIVGCGGVSSGLDAYEKIRAGASLVQLYTGLIYQGPVLVPRIKTELAQLLARDGFESVEEAVGADTRVKKGAGFLKFW